MKCLFFLFFLLSTLYVQAEKYDFEDAIPSSIQTTEGNHISLSTTYYKEGGKSLEWDYQPQSYLIFHVPVQLNSSTVQNYGITLWIYNEIPQKDSLRFEFLDKKGTVQFQFSFHLAATGWRACWIGFKHMQGKKENLSLAQCRITSPATKGKIYLDRMTYPVKKINDRTTPDKQMPDNNSLSSRNLWHWCRLWEWEQYEDLPNGPKKLTTQEKETLQKIMEKVSDYCRENLSRKYISQATSLFESCHIQKSGNGYIGKPLVAPDEKSAEDITWQDVEKMLSGFAADYLFNGNLHARELYFETFRYAINQGFAYGSGMGTNHHYGYQTRQIYLSAWLMRKEICQQPDKKDIMDMLTYWSGIQETRKPCKEGRDELLDTWHTLLIPKVIAALLPEKDTEKAHRMTQLSQWLSSSLRFTPGTLGGIKVDGTAFHHGGFYPGYTTGALGAVGSYIGFTLDTPYQITPQGRTVFRLALESMRNYCNWQEWALSLGGRHPFSGKMEKSDIEAFAMLALAEKKEGQAFDRQLAADYLRLQPNPTVMHNYFVAEGCQAASNPEGFFVFNYGSAGIYRYGKYMVTLKGYNTDVWGAEIYQKDNRYGRYQSYGAVLLMGNGKPVSRKGSGFKEEGWDWNRLPGTTTIHLPFHLLDSPRKGTTMVRSKENFSGCSSLKGKYGLFAMKLTEGELPNFTPDFVARKSVACFGNRIICLGSGIHNSNSDYPTETTLFQCALPKNYKRYIQTDPQILRDPFGNYFYVKDGEVQQAEGLQHSFHNKNKKATEGNFLTAWINHGKAPQNAQYEYLILLQPTAEERKGALESYTIQQHDNQAHILFDKLTQVTACAFFETYNCTQAPFLQKADAETLVMYKPEGQSVWLSICSPNLNISEKTYTTAQPSRPLIKQITVKGKWTVADNPQIRFLYDSDGNTVIQATCQDGQPQEFRLTSVQQTE